MEDVQGLKVETIVNKNTEIYRISIHTEAEKALLELLEKVHKNFDSGKISKSELVSWVLVHANKSYTGVEFQTLRSDHFDEIAALESLLKRSKEAGSVSADLKLLLLKQEGLDSSIKKNTKIKSR